MARRKVITVYVLFGEVSLEDKPHSTPLRAGLADGFRVARATNGQLRIFGPGGDMTVEAAIQTGALVLR
jgi:hypothetical protein